MRLTRELWIRPPAYRPPSMTYHLLLPDTVSPCSSARTLTLSPPPKLPTMGAFKVEPARTLVWEVTVPHHPPGARLPSGLDHILAQGLVESLMVSSPT